MAEIRKYPVLRHFRGDPSMHVLKFARGRLSASGRGLTFWFHPLNTSIAAIPVDDREIPFLFHARSADFQDAAVQGVITFRVEEPELLAERVDFSVDLKTGAPMRQPMEKLTGALTELAQQFAAEYVAGTELQAIVGAGLEPIRSAIEHGLRAEAAVGDMGIRIVAVRVNAISPEPEVEMALQTPTREAIQQRADQATFERRAQAVEKERAIRENELQNEIELAKREESLIEQHGQNERRRASEGAAAGRIEAEAKAERTSIDSRAEAESIELVESARIGAEREKMGIYRDMPPEVMMGLAAQRLAGKLNRIEHLNVTPDLLGGLLTNLVQAGTRRLEHKDE